MREDIFNFLRKHQNEFVSGQQISEQLGVSRTAVWKHIRALKQRGYVIESYTKKGYCLREAPDLLSAKEIEKSLSTMEFGRNLVYRERVDSTNNLAKALADDGAPEGTVVIAEEQTGGRGRLSRSFHSPFAKGLWFSIILRPAIPPMEVSKMTLLAAVALARSLRFHGLSDCGIKWPNDILIHGRKMVGILTELNGSAEKVNYIIMGIGVNTGITAGDLPEELKDIVTSFAREGVSVRRQDLLKTILMELERLYHTVCREGFAPILAEWRTLSCMLGQKVAVSSVGRTFTGTASDIDDDGNLIVETETGMEKVMAGDVHVRSV
ncbi:biotin--[acetyl-CoA-carboxylase] ligase [uncultured Megasphaera sp.]|uniref:biotin--[acetyl-CoA-carboxylase] ligase n=1 Tax=uncultured Megasphaera sp. TaxID=165188 RepID=UPI0025F2D61E|nr:biotin--[acetyl-CoA-carboxylase] ligase [uncultured Megasphaera sp.]